MSKPEDDILPTFDFPGEAAAPPAEVVPVAVPVTVPAGPPPQVNCPCCSALRRRQDTFCGDCGWFYKDPYPSDADLAAGTLQIAPPLAPVAAVRIKGRYELLEQLSERLGVERFRALDLGVSGTESTPVIVLKQAGPEDLTPVVPEEVGETEPVLPLVNPEDEFLPSFDDVVVPMAGPVTEAVPKQSWPSIVWERDLLDALEYSGLPAVLDTFFEEGFQYVVEEVPAGRSLWDFWDDPDNTHRERFTALVKVAEILQTLHRLGAMVEGVRPELFVLDAEGQPRITDLADLLPLPVPADAPLRGRLYSAPELLTTPAKADARADLYSFGAMLLALNLGRELTEKEFVKPGHPNYGRLFLDYPDMHPAMARLLMKTFTRAIESRFPSDEAAKTDPTGFGELIKTLKVLARTMDQCRLEVSAWTTTGMVRTGNEDAFAFLHATESRQDDVSDACLILLADGMGGYDAGEVAAAMCLAQLRKNLTALKPFNATAGASGFPTDIPHHTDNSPLSLDVELTKSMLKAALKDANKHVFTASRTPGVGKRGMGCTAEAVYVDGRNIVVGHVGDSRTYHLSEGTLIQITRDQTLVNRLVELGTLSADEAENHPRKNELQQAIGGQPDVEPGIYAARLKPGDYVFVCSDGLTNHIKDKMLRDFLKGDDGASAERAARRLMHMVNMEGATDNATIVVVRVS